MRKYLLILISAISALASIAQTAATATDSGSFLLHKFAQNIGRETYTITKQGINTKYDINFKFTDRGSPVALQAQLLIAPTLNPIQFFIKGNTSRFTTINDTIRIKNKQAQIRVDDSIYSQPVKPLSFTVGGYSPGVVQMLLLQYWKKQKEPKSIALLPFGEVKIKRDGRDTVMFNGKKVFLERYVIAGLIWGNEIAWTDKNGKLICLITNDAEGDKLEMMRDEYETLLPELLSRAAKYGMQLFTASMKVKSVKKGPVAILGGNIINVEDGSIIPHSVIIIENGVITAIGNAETVRIPSTTPIIHAEGKTILPGLWDMHAHFQQAEWGPAYLAAGVTTVRDCGNEFAYINAIKSAIDAHKGVGPLILKAGIVDGPGPRGLGIVRASTEEEAKKVVQDYKDNGFVQIKIYSSVKPPIVKAICDEAHRLGLTVTGHIPNGMNIMQGVDSGMDQVNHIQYVYSAMKRNKDMSVDLNDSTNNALLDYLAAHHTVIDATIGVFEMIFRSTDDDIRDMEPAFYTLPLPLQTLFKTIGMPADAAKQNKPVYDGMKNIIKALHDKGVILVAGTDMGFPGYSLHRELELYVEAGLTPLQAIQSATIVPAQVMKLDGKTGSIKIGKQADLIILDGDPLLQIRNIRKVWKVIKEGEEYEPGVLRGMVRFGG